MLQFFTLLSLALALVQGMALPESQKRDTASPLKLDFTVSNTVGNATAQEFWAKYGAHQNKRDGYAVPIADFRDLSYQIDVSLGSNQQKNTVVLDTGSSDLWVPGPGYDPTSSTTAQDTGVEFSIGYLDGSGASGEYYTDTLQFDTAEPVLQNFQFAQAEVTDGGVLGVADKNQEATQNTYNNLPWALQEANITPKASYSLFLGPEGGSGSIIFGGVDTEKYTGELARYNVDKSTGGLAVDLQTVNFGGKTIAVNAPALLDSGTSLGLLNSELIQQLDVIFKTTVQTQGSIQYRTTSCDQPSDKFLEFNFGSNTIAISYADAIVKNQDGTCLLGFGYYNNISILGDVFLRKAYVYYDITDSTISLAQASYSSDSNIVSA